MEKTSPNMNLQLKKKMRNLKLAAKPTKFHIEYYIEHT